MTSMPHLLLILSCMSLQTWVAMSTSSRRRLDDMSEAGQASVLSYHQSKTWNATRTFGQISAVAINRQHNVVVFHRGSHVWDGYAFTLQDTYTGPRDSPISEETVVILDPVTGSELDKWGSKLFFMPHGLTIDDEGNYWITDVAMHQVFKFGPKGGPKPLLQMGEPFIPGSSSNHFCKPTSVAVHSVTKAIYVADGYCNSRLMQFGPDGQFVRQWGHGGTMSLSRSSFNFIVPHKVVLIEEHDEACISDRENGRIKCLDIRKKNQVTIDFTKTPEWNRLFSISYAKCSPVDMFFAVTGPSLSDSEPEQPVMAYGVSYKEQRIMTSMAPTDASKKIPTFSNPHDIVSSKDCKNVYVVEIGPNLVWKFMTTFYGPNADTMNVSLITGNKAGSQPIAQSSFFGSFFLKISAVVLVVIVIIALVRRSKASKYGFSVNFLRRGMANSRDSFDLGRLLEDPEKSGFNRVSTHEIDADDGELSDSEVEEFNVSNVRNGLKV